MAVIAKVNIDLTKIPKDKVYVGKKGKYLPIVIKINDEADNYDNHGPVEVEQTLEEREGGVPKVYLGNVKVVWTNGEIIDPKAGGGSKPKAKAAPVVEEEDDDLPF